MTALNINTVESRQWTVKSANAFTGGGICKPNSKVPGWTFSTATSQCTVGTALRRIAGSTCHKCYAVNIEKRYPSAAKSWLKRGLVIQAMAMMPSLQQQWIDAMTFLIMKRVVNNPRYENLMRWSVAGDLINYEHLLMVIEIARLTPMVRHWLPTREYSLIKRLAADGVAVPDNLVIRVSDAMVDQQSNNYAVQSGVTKNRALRDNEHGCPAYFQGNNCGECRACWDADVVRVIYPLH